MYHWTLVVGRIDIVNRTTLATEGWNADKVRNVFYDEWRVAPGIAFVPYGGG